MSNSIKRQYGQYMADDNSIVIRATFLYSDDDQHNLVAQGDYFVHNDDGDCIDSDRFDVVFDGQGSAFKLFDEYYFRRVAEDIRGYDEIRGQYLEIDSITYVTDMKEPEDKSTFYVDAVINFKPEEI